SPDRSLPRRAKIAGRPSTSSAWAAIVAVLAWPGTPPPRYQTTFCHTGSLAEPVGVSITFFELIPTPSTGALIRSEGILSSRGRSTGPARRSRPGSINCDGTRSWSADGPEAGGGGDGGADGDTGGDRKRTGWPAL